MEIPEGIPSEGLIDRLINALGGSARASVVYGEATRQDGVTVIPVARVGWRGGFGGGQGRGEDGSGGGGGGMVSATPVGYIEIRDGQTQFRPIRPSGAVGVLTVLGGTVVLSLAVIGWAWGRPRASGET